MIETYETVTPDGTPVKDNTPKKAMSPFLYFSKEQMALHKAKYPNDLKDGGILKIIKDIGKKWSSLTSEEKFRYDEASKKDKIRYSREMEEYKKINKTKKV